MKNFFKKTRTYLFAFSAFFIAAYGLHAEQNYPTKPIKLIVAFPPGGSIDMAARMIGPKLSAALGQPVLIDNRPGASGNIGMDFVAKAPKDGYTLLVAHAGIAANAHLFAKLPFDPIKDFSPVIRVAIQPNVLLVNPKWSFKNVGELVAYAKANPGKLSFGTSGVGGPQDVAARMFMQSTGTDMLNVAYKGGAPALADLLGGQIDLMFETSPTAVPHFKAGKLKALAVTGEKRLSTMPDVPTVAESGVTGYKSVGWIGVLAPNGTPREIVSLLHGQLEKILLTKEMQMQLADVSLELASTSSVGFGDFIKSESNFYAQFVKQAKITPQ